MCDYEDDRLSNGEVCLGENNLHFYINNEGREVNCVMDKSMNEICSKKKKINNKSVYIPARTRTRSEDELLLS